MFVSRIMGSLQSYQKRERHKDVGEREQHGADLHLMEVPFPPFTDLPYVCTRHILSLLSVSEQLKCGEVCGMWREIVWELLRLRQSLVISRVYSDADGFVSQQAVFGGGGCGFKTLLQHVPNLENLDVRGVCSANTQQIIEGLVREKRALRSVRFGELDGTIDSVVFKEMIDNLLNLERFEALYNYSLDCNTIVSYLLHNALSLEHLDLSQSKKLTSDVFRGMVQKLKVLKLTDCRDISSNILEFIFPSCRTSLNYLDLKGTFNVNVENECLLRLGQFTNLRTLRLTCNNLHCPYQPCQATPYSHLSALSHLTELYLTYSCCLHDADVASISSACSGLQVLQLQHYATRHSLTAEGLMFLSHFTSLNTLELDRIYTVTDHNLRVWAPNMKLLESLTLHGPHITPRGLTHLAEFCNNLKMIQVFKVFKFDISNKRDEMEEMLQVFSERQQCRGNKLEIALREEKLDIDSHEAASEWVDTMMRKYQHEKLQVTFWWRRKATWADKYEC